ncbi:uroporphyrinogen decarboxylase family protein [Desulfitibacter alkalitolerans]|uniref:uroporphyrinogen decarboxylase family protein n=1 Tax=Desulfitibacter alkalitolerans TaxID=264641 RepID=UPI00048811F4|nr:uroporphyrinogen decarboxylase family protein [Desulfitibacter alkalitolerans]
MYKLEVFLKDLEDRIDEEIENDLIQQWKDFVDGNFSGKVFAPTRKKTFISAIEWPHIMVNDTLDDIDNMVLQQYALCSKSLSEGNGELLSVRCNFGTGIIPSLFGAETFLMPYEYDTLPASKKLPNGKADINKIIKKGVPSINNYLGKKVFEVAERFIEIGQQYPRIGAYINIYAPDTQGPMAVCQSLWGSELYLDLCYDADLAHEMLSLATETFIEFTNQWFKAVPPAIEGYCVNWSMLHKGKVVIRNDDAMNISPEMFNEFIRPYDQKILDEFDGGVIHFCGRGDHYIHLLHQMRGVHAINMSQPECNNMDIIYQNTIDKGIMIIGLKHDEVERALSMNVDFKGRVHVGSSIAAWQDDFIKS